MRLWAQHVALLSPYNAYKPKHHLIFHLIFDSQWFGNPNHYSCWYDEALNKVLKQACRLCSQSVFEQSLLMQMRDILNSGALGRNNSCM